MSNANEKIKIKLSRVLTELSETKNRLALAEHKLLEKISIMKDWAIRAITEV